MVSTFSWEPPECAQLNFPSKATDVYKTLAALEKDGEPAEPDFTLSRISFQLAQLVDDYDKRQTVLSLRSEVERLEYLIRVVPEYITQREQTALARRLAPMNGHAKAIH